MAKRQPKVEKVKIESRPNQSSATGGFMLNRPVQSFQQPNWQEADYWRKFVERQSIASICRDTIANYLNSLDWAIVARDSDQTDELRGQIKHYTKLFERGNAYSWDIDFSSQVEWFVKDLFTLPFGTASELGRLDDNPKGRVVWIRPLDAGTLSPTLNFEYPVLQNVPGDDFQPIYLAKEYVSRVYLSPRTELRREGWGYAPPERVWRALEMMYAGDNYYSQLLLNTPEAGILDLGDMDATSAKEWVAGVEATFYGISPFKIPVLYEHTTQAKFIPFGKPPSEIMYDSVTLRYAAIVCAGYGLTLSDIGMPSSSNGGETLAGTIRQERTGKSSGKSIAKKKFEAYANRILNQNLMFTWIDYDDEKNISKGRARLATAQAGAILIDKQALTGNELRRQIISDGLVTISIPEEMPKSEIGVNGNNRVSAGLGNKTAEIGAKVNPSLGGHGETIPQQVIQRSEAQVLVSLSKSAYKVNEIMVTLLANVDKNLNAEETAVWDEYVDSYLAGRGEIAFELKSVFDGMESCARPDGEWVAVYSEHIKNRALQKSLSQLAQVEAVRLNSQAEDDFISGKIDDLKVATPKVSLQIEKSENLYRIISDKLTALVSKRLILVSKKFLSGDALKTDPTEFKAENIRISKAIGSEVLESMNRIVEDVYLSAVEYMTSP